MPRLTLARRALIAAMACSAVLAPILLTPTAAWADAPDPSSCSGLYHGTPPGSLAMTTSVPGGTVLHPGDSVSVTATWNTADWPAPELHKVLDCLLVHGTVDYGHSTQEKPTANDGVYDYSFTVPAGAGGEICDRVRLSGRLVPGGDLVVQKSNTVCFPVADAGPASVPGIDAPSPVLQAADAPPTPPLAQELVQEAAPEAAPAATPPAVEVSPAMALSPPTLPRTGGDVLPLAWAGLVAIVLGVSSLAARTVVTRMQNASPRAV